jgi:hypothetical protein
MKKILLILLVVIGYASNASAQTSVTADTSCSFLKNIKFKNGVDTVVVKVLFRAYTEGSDEPRLKILADKKELSYGEYVSEDFGSNAFSFIPVNCTSRYDGTLSRKIYDKTFIRKTKDLNAYLKEVFDVDTLKHDEVIYLTCLVFEDQRTIDRSGDYFFTIIDLKVPGK